MGSVRECAAFWTSSRAAKQIYQGTRILLYTRFFKMGRESNLFRSIPLTAQSKLQVSPEELFSMILRTDQGRDGAIGRAMSVVPSKVAL